MKAHKIVILVIAVLLTVAVGYHEYMYDYPEPTMTAWDYVLEAAFVGTAYATLFYFIMLGIYMLIVKVRARF